MSYKFIFLFGRSQNLRRSRCFLLSTTKIPICCFWLVPSSSSSSMMMIGIGRFTISTTTTKGVRRHFKHRATVAAERIQRAIGHGIYKTTSVPFITQTWDEACNFYEHFMNANEVREANNKVTSIQRMLEESHVRSSVLMRELTTIRGKHRLLNDKLMKCNRRDLQYVHLVQLENQVINAMAYPHKINNYLIKYIIYFYRRFIKKKMQKWMKSNTKIKLDAIYLRN